MRALAVSLGGAAVIAALLIHAGAGSAGAPSVATVRSAAGASLYLLDVGSGKTRRLHKGAKIHPGDIIAAGPGSRAVLTLARPRHGLKDAGKLFSVSKQLQSGPPRLVMRDFTVLGGAAIAHRQLSLRRSGTTVLLKLSH